jgi:GNAT superfamily N-acetyltransferase
LSITFRPYVSPQDYQRISDFLIGCHLPGNRDGNWLEPAWEYMHSHPYFDPAALGNIGIWEDGGEIIAVAHYESRLGEAFFQFHPAHRSLRRAMLDHAEARLARRTEQEPGGLLRLYIHENDADFLALAQERGYRRDPPNDRPLYRFDIPHPFPAIPLAAGFRLTSLAEEPDWAKVHRVIWRGFNHDGEPPMDAAELESRRAMFDTPTARRDLKIAVTAPNGEFAAFCGMFYEPAGRFAYVEPVATDPAYRRLGLGRAAVLEGIRRCAALGAGVAYVGSDQAFYQAIGFVKVYLNECWLKRGIASGG